MLPVVGEGITGSPVIGPATMDCGANGGKGPKVGVIPDAGIGYVFNRDGTTCQGKDSNGRDNGLTVVERPYSFDEWRADAASE